MRTFDLEHIRIRPYHPESNGKLDRFHRTTRDALDAVELQNLGRARELIGRWVAHYNTERLHAGLNYLPPADYYAGDPEARLTERRQKLAAARHQLRVRNEGRVPTAA